jgi:hypothetical protein
MHTWSRQSLPILEALYQLDAIDDVCLSLPR